MKIAVISDTHNLLRPELLQALRSADEIIHAGDICNADVVKELAAIAPLRIVRGNNDCGDWAIAIPETLELKTGGLTVFVIHDRKQLPAAMPAYDLVITGHSHRPGDELIDGQRFLNPGSCGPRRFNLPVSMAWLTITAAGFDIELVELV